MRNTARAANVGVMGRGRSLVRYEAFLKNDLGLGENLAVDRVGGIHDRRGRSVTTRRYRRQLGPVVS